MSLNEARKNLEACLGDEFKKEYFALLRQWFMFSAPITKEEFDRRVRGLLVNEDQIRCHNYFLLEILAKINSSTRPPTVRPVQERTIFESTNFSEYAPPCSSTTLPPSDIESRNVEAERLHNSRPKSIRSSSEKGIFECADFSEYIQPSSPTMLPPSDFENRSAAAELFIPDKGFIASRIAVAAWENGLEGADDNVTELMVHACQTLVRNIITAMISRIKGYKIRDGKFQYGFNQTVPDPFLRNFNNVIDNTQESKIEVGDEEDSFKPKCKISLENAEQQVAFSYSCSKKWKSDNVLSVRLLYDTLKDNPKILGLHSIQSTNLLRLSLQLDDDEF